MVSVIIPCVLTPGHTSGVLSFFFDMTWEGKTYLAGLFGGAGLNALTLPYINHNVEAADAPEQMLRSVERVWDEPVTTIPATTRPCRSGLGSWPRAEIPFLIPKAGTHS